MYFKSAAAATLALILATTASGAVAQTAIVADAPTAIAPTYEATETSEFSDGQASAPPTVAPAAAAKPKSEPTVDGNFMLYEKISQESVKTLITQLDQWARKNPNRPFKLMLNSPGGDVLASFALIDELNHLRATHHRLTIVVYGMAASAAGYLLQTADERIIGANSTILIHEISGGEQGKLSAMQEAVAYYARLENQFLQLIVRRSHLTMEEIHRHIDGHDWWLSADEALAAGLVDSIEKVPPVSK